MYVTEFILKHIYLTLDIPYKHTCCAIKKSQVSGTEYHEWPSLFATKKMQLATKMEGVAVGQGTGIIAENGSDESYSRKNKANLK